MSLKYSVDAATETVFIKAEGYIEVEELLALGPKLLNHPDVGVGFKRYVDFSQAAPGYNVEYEKLQNLVGFIASTQVHRGNCRWALYAKNIDTLNFAKIIVRLLKRAGLDAEVFSNEDKAKEWLDI